MFIHTCKITINQTETYVNQFEYFTEVECEGMTMKISGRPNRWQIANAICAMMDRDLIELDEEERKYTPEKITYTLKIHSDMIE